MSEEVRALTYVEVDVDHCTLTWGVAPCQAALSEETPRKCHQTASTCGDRDNYSPEPLTLRYAIATDYLPSDVSCIPNIVGVSTAPTKLNPGKNLGQRESITVTFEDHRYHDIGLDKYVEERKTGVADFNGETYIPIEQGTYWGKWRNRNRFYLGRPLRLIQGRLGQTLEEMETRHYVIEKVEGPSADGKFQIVAKDILKLADEERAQAPNASPGTLRSDMSTGSISIIEVDNAETSDYPSSGRVRIGKEVFSYTGISESGSGIEFTGVSRAQLDTEEEEHDEEDTVQEVLSYEGERPSDIAYDLLTTYGGIDTSYIDLTRWNNEDEEFIGRLYTGHISDPTGVRQLINELSQECGFFIWPDITVPEIRFRAIRTPGTTAADITDDDIVGPAPAPKEQPKKRRSQVWVFYARRSPTERMDEPSNYRSISVTVDADAASSDEYGQDNIEKIFSRWIAQFNRPAADDLGDRILQRFRDPPRAFAFRLPYFDPGIDTGDLFNIITRTMQDATGAADTRRSIVLSMERGLGKVLLEAEEFNYDPPDDPDEHLVVIDSNAEDFNLRDAHDSIYASVESGDTIRCVIESGIVVGSSDPSIPAFHVGSWPSSVTIIIENNGRIQGAGGKGGRGGNATQDSAANGEDGGDGGTALYTRYAISIENNEIWGGGGGGGGGGGASVPPPGTATQAAGGGGGGGGVYVGSGGAGGAATNASDKDNGAPGDEGGVESPGDGGEGGSLSNARGGDGGSGGGPAESGSPGSSGSASGGAGGENEGSGGSGGSPGNAVDGDSFVAYDVAGDIKGGQIN